MGYIWDPEDEMTQINHFGHFPGMSVGCHGVVCLGFTTCPLHPAQITRKLSLGDGFGISETGLAFGRSQTHLPNSDTIRIEKNPLFKNLVQNLHTGKNEKKKFVLGDCKDRLKIGASLFAASSTPLSNENLRIEDCLSCNEKGKNMLCRQWRLPAYDIEP